VVFEKGWINLVLASYGLLIAMVFMFIVLLSLRRVYKEITVEEFEKTLEGRLYHFKCPNCSGFFAVKKSKRDNKKPVKMTCPDCGEIGVIPPFPKRIEADIPEKKSVNINFKCKRCDEDITIWAEGAELYPYLRVYSCPYCGEEKTMNRV
jgi:Zn finger protein HypA/HybF involved in hydrogenase expression